MIRINLAKSSAFPSEAESAGGGVSLPSFGGFATGAGENPLAKVAVILAFPLILYIYEYQGLSSYRTTLQQKDAELVQVKNDIAQFGSAGTAVADIKVERERLQKRLEVIAQISSKRAFKIQTLSELQKMIPDDCWLDLVEIGATEIQFSGYSRTPSSVQIFVERLGKLKFLSEVTNQGLVRKQLGETSVHEFTVVAQVQPR